MAINKFFQQHTGQTNEADLFQSLVTESIQIHGVESHYIIRETQNIDSIFQEDPLASFDESFCIEVYVDTFDGFGGSEGDFMSKFGLQLQDRITLSISTERFREESTFTQPREGDLIYLPLSKTLFEIQYVEDEEPFYSLGKVPYFRITGEIFDYSGEEFNTGITDVDLLDADLTDNTDLNNIQDQDINDEFDFQDDGIIDFDIETPFGEFGSDA